jgi:outer membrane receptor protein involved in Fe transport
VAAPPPAKSAPTPEVPSPAAPPAQAVPAEAVATPPTPADADSPPVVLKKVFGIVYDAATAEPVRGATVEVVGTDKKTKSKKDGSFEIDGLAPGNYTLSFEKPPLIGTTSEVTVPIAGEAPAVEALLIGEVESVKITSYVKRESPAPGGTQVTREEITRVPGARGDVLAAVTSLPGIAHTGGLSQFSGGIIIRGSAPSDTRVLVDGFEVPILFHFGGVQSVLASEFIDNIVYAPGGFGVENGRASSGIISVRTRAGAKKWGGFAEVSFINGGLFLQGPLGGPDSKTTFSLSFRRSFVDAILPLVLPTDGTLSFSALPRYYDYQGRVDHQLSDRLRLSLVFFGTDDGIELVTRADNPMDPLATGRFSNDTTFQRLIGSVTYEGDKFKSRLAMSGQMEGLSFNVSSARYLHLNNWGFGIRNENNLTINKWLALSFGAENQAVVWDYDINSPRPRREGDPKPPSFSGDPPLQLKVNNLLYNSVAGWAAVELRPTERLMIKGGGRYDGYLRNEDHVFHPRGEVSFDAKVVTVRASGGLYSRPPSYQDELTQTSLKSEKAWQATGGFERELGNGLSAKLTGFYTWRRDLITFKTDRSDPSVVNEPYINRGKGRTFGAEALIQARGETYFGWLAYTISRSLRRDSEDRPERLFDFDQTHNLTIVGSKKFGKERQWQFGGRFQYTTGKPYTPVIGAVFDSNLNRYNPRFAAVNSDRVESLHQLDLRIDRIFQFAKWRLMAYLDVTNVYMNPSVISYTYNYDYTQKDGVKTLPILPALGLRGEF